MQNVTSVEQALGFAPVQPAAPITIPKEPLVATNQTAQAVVDSIVGKPKQVKTPKSGKPAINDVRLFLTPPSVGGVEDPKTLDELQALVSKTLEDVIKATGMDKDGVVITAEQSQDPYPRIRQRRVRGGYVINYTVKGVLGLTAEEFIIELVHELAHVKNDYNFVEDMRESGNYHNDEFKATIEGLGALTAWTRSAGYAGNIGLSAELAAKLPAMKWGNELLTKASPIFAKPVKVKVNRSPIYKMLCPNCAEFIYVQGKELTTEEAWLAQESKRAEAQADSLLA